MTDDGNVREIGGQIMRGRWESQSKT